jgi:hypothetical protein
MIGENVLATIKNLVKNKRPRHITTTQHVNALRALKQLQSATTSDRTLSLEFVIYGTRASSKVSFGCNRGLMGIENDRTIALILSFL